jgi:hypothetical protein
MRPKTLNDVGMRFPPPPGTRFYVCFRVNEFAAWPPYEEMLTVVADHPQDAIEQVLRDGKGPTDPSLRCVSAVCFNHNGRARFWSGWIGDPPAERQAGLIPMPPNA